jgi:hypothetical protein
MQNLTVHLGSATPLSSRAGPCAPALSTASADRSASPVSGARRPRAPRLGRCWAPSSGRGQAPRHPHATWHPHLSLLFSLLPRCRRATRSPLALLHLSSCLHSSLTPPLERPSLPTAPYTWTAASIYRQPTLPCGFRPSTAAVRHSPVSSSPSCQSLHFLTIFSPPCLSSAARPHTHRRHPPEPPPHRRTPSSDAVCAVSPSTRRSGAPLPSPPCPAPSP